MTTSGTTDFQLNWTEIIEEAWERVGLEVRDGYSMRSSRRSINLMMLEWANRGLNMWSYEERTQLLTYGVGSYLLGADIVDVLEQVVQLPPYGATPQISRINMNRVSISTQATRTNPNILGRPVEVYYHRGTDGVTAHVWPLPGDSGPFTLVYHVLRRIEDAGAFTDSMDAPNRWMEAIAAGLAAKLAVKFAPDRLEFLQGLADGAYGRAAAEDREKVPLRITIDQWSY